MARFETRFRRWLGSGLVLLAVALLLVALPGCPGGGELETAPVQGSVTYEGKPVTGGSITFRPTQAAGGAGGATTGKPASGAVQADGSFVLTTYEASDGAVVGQHEVMYTAPTVELPYDEDNPPEGYEKLPVPESPYQGLVPKTKQVEVKAGGNDFTIELVRPEGAGGPGNE